MSEYNEIVATRVTREIAQDLADVLSEEKRIKVAVHTQKQPMWGQRGEKSA
jgi:hypothetical protein